jgi:hypothetical protein
MRDAKTITINHSNDRARMPNNIGALVVLVVFLSISVIVQVTTSTRLVPFPETASRMTTDISSTSTEITSKTEAPSRTTLSLPYNPSAGIFEEKICNTSPPLKRRYLHVLILHRQHPTFSKFSQIAVYVEGVAVAFAKHFAGRKPNQNSSRSN